MSFSSVIERDYALRDMMLVNEFDVSSFVSNAKASINNTFNGVKITPVRFEMYIDMLQKVTNEFISKAQVDSDKLANFRNMINQVDDSMGMVIPCIVDSDVTTVKPGYISQMVGNMKTLIQNFIQDKMSESDVVSFYYGEFTLKVKRQAVVTTIPYMSTSRSIINLESDKQETMELTKKNLFSNVLPFVENFKNAKFEVLKETSKLAEVITSASNDISIITTTVNNTIPSLDPKKAQLLSRFVYNLYKSVLEVVSFTTMCMIRKINNLSENIVKCENIYNTVRATCTSSVIESAIDSDVFPTDSDTIADNIINGRVDTFEVLSSNIYDSAINCLEGILFTDIDNGENGELDILVQKAEYSKDPYEEASKIFISIKTGLEIIVQNSDDITISFEELMQKSGFTMDINDHYRSNLSAIDDLALYNGESLVPTQSKEVILSMLHEVSDYEKNMKQVSDNISDVFDLISNIKDRYTKNINNDLKNTELVNEIKVFLNTLVEQYRRLSSTVATKFMERLKSISFILEKKCGTTVDGNIVSNDVEESVDFVDMALESCIEDLENNIACMMEQMQREYFVMKYESVTGAKPVFEADDTQNNNQNQNQNGPIVQDGNTQNNNQKTTTKVSVTDGQNTAGTVKKVVQSIARFLNQLINKFLGLIKKNGARNKKFFNDNGSYLKSRKYINCSVNILPYVAQNVTIRDIGTVTSFITGLTPQALEAINSKEEAYRKVIPMVNNIKIDDKKQTTDEITRYCKVGSAQLNTVTKKDGEISSLMNTVVTESIDYWGDNPSIVSKLQELSKACENKEKTLGLNISQDNNTENTNQNNNNQNQNNTNVKTESVEIVYLEADDQNNQSSSISDKFNWVSEAVRLYVGCVMNAMRDKYNDYYTLAYQFAQANIKNNQNNNQNQQGNNQQQQQPEQQQNNNQ